MWLNKDLKKIENAQIEYEVNNNSKRTDSIERIVTREFIKGNWEEYYDKSLSNFSGDRIYYTFKIVRLPLYFFINLPI